MRLGLIAGNGRFPFLVLEAARGAGHEVTVIALKQGIGRLIRSNTDRGVIAILDPRLRTKGYGRDFLNSLPRMRITSDLKDVEDIFEFSAKGSSVI